MFSQDEYEKNRDVYTQVWRLALSNLLHWDEERIRLWSERWFSEIAWGVIFHEDPEHYVAYAILEERTCLMGSQLVRAANAIQKLLLAARIKPSDEAIPWRELSDAINDIIKVEGDE